MLLTMVLSFRNGQYTNSRRLSRISDAGKFATHLLVAVCVVALLLLATNGFFSGSLDFSRLIVTAASASSSCWPPFSGCSWPSASGPCSCRAWPFGRCWCWATAGVGRLRALPGQAPLAGRGLRGQAPLPRARRWHGRGLAGRGPATTSPPATRASRTWTGSGCPPGPARWWSRSTPRMRPAPRHHRTPLPRPRALQGGALPLRGDLPVRRTDGLCGTPRHRRGRRSARPGGAHLQARAGSIVSSSVLLLGLLPAVALVLAIKLDSRGPVFFKQARIGRNGRRFYMYKFRTMVVNADALVDELSAERGGRRRRDLQDQERSPHHPGGPFPAQVEPGRTPADPQRLQGRDEPGGAAAAAAARGGDLRSRSTTAGSRACRASPGSGRCRAAAT